MLRILLAVVAALAIPAAASACESVQLVSPVVSYSAPVSLVAPVVYQPKVLAIEVAEVRQAYAIEVQQVVVKKQRHRRQPVKAFVQAVTTPRKRCH